MPSVEQLLRSLIELASSRDIASADYSHIEDELRPALCILLRESAARLRYPGVLKRTRARIETDVSLEVCEELLIDIRREGFKIKEDGRLAHDGEDCKAGFAGYALDILKSRMDGRVNIDALALEAMRKGCNDGEWNSLFNLMNNGLFRNVRHKLSNCSDDEWKDVMADTWTTVIEQINSGKLSVKDEGNTPYLEYKGEKHRSGFAAHCYGILGNNIKRARHAAGKMPVTLDEEPADVSVDADTSDCIRFCLNRIEIEKHKVALCAWYNWQKYETYLSDKFSRYYDFIKFQLRAAGLETDNENTIASWISRGKSRFKELYATHCR